MRSLILTLCLSSAVAQTPTGAPSAAPSYAPTVTGTTDSPTVGSYAPTTETYAPTTGACPNSLAAVPAGSCPGTPPTLFCDDPLLVTGDLCLATARCQVAGGGCTTVTRRRLDEEEEEEDEEFFIMEVLDAPTAAPVTMAPTPDSPPTAESRRRELNDLVMARKLFFVDFNEPGSGTTPKRRSRLFDAEKGCRDMPWAKGHCAIKLSEVSNVCLDWEECKGVLCGGIDAKIDGAPACVVTEEMDFGATHPGSYALTKDAPPGH